MVGPGAHKPHQIKPHQIKPHQKTRTGCYQCKSRRVKCDELRPKCSRCVRYTENCIYPPALPKASGLASEFLGHSGSGPIEVQKGVNNSTTELNLSDLELLQNWTIKAHIGIGITPRDEKVWKEEVPQLALKHPFLMRGILAVSALHMGRATPEEKPRFLALAAYHKNLALPSYRYIVDDIASRMDKSNCRAVLAFGIITTVYAFSAPHPPGSILFAGLCSSTGVPEWLRMLRGNQAIRGFAREWSLGGEYSFSIGGVPDNIEYSLNPDDVLLAALETTLQSTEIVADLGADEEAGNSEEQNTYMTTLTLLRQCFALPYQQHPSCKFRCASFLWVEKVPDKFLEYMDDLRPLSLIFLCYFCVMLKKCSEEYWFIKGAPERILKEIINILGGEWREWIAWPISQVLGDDNILLCATQDSMVYSAV